MASLFFLRHARLAAAMFFKRKRKTLPKDFSDMLEKASLEQLIAVFDACDLEATGGYSKQTALGFYKCPEALARWLVAQGADVNAPDSYGRTPLHERATSWLGGVELLLDLGAAIEARDHNGFTPLHAAARSHKPAAVRALIQRGADIHSANQRGQTALDVNLGMAANADIEDAAAIADLLLAAGATPGPGLAREVERMGREFEFHRSNFNPEMLPAADAGLTRLYQLFNVAPVASRRVHDGTSPITVPDGPWRAQYKALWELLVPSQGAAATAQGEAIRITGRVSREILDIGGANWDADFRTMLDALVPHLRTGTPLPGAELTEAASIAATLRAGHGDEDPIDRLAELTVQWIIANPQPIALKPPAYKR